MTNYKGIWSEFSLKAQLFTCQAILSSSREVIDLQM